MSRLPLLQDLRNVADAPIGNLSVTTQASCQLCPSSLAWVAAEMPCHTSQTSRQYEGKALSCLSTALAVDSSPPGGCGKLCLSIPGPESHLYHSATFSEIVLSSSHTTHSTLPQNSITICILLQHCRITKADMGRHSAQTLQRMH